MDWGRPFWDPFELEKINIIITKIFFISTCLNPVRHSLLVIYILHHNVMIFETVESHRLISLGLHDHTLLVEFRFAVGLVNMAGQSDFSELT